MDPDRDTRLVPVAFTLIGILVALYGLLLMDVNYLVIAIGGVIVFYAWFYFFPCESKRAYMLNIQAIKEELNHYPTPIVEFQRVLSEEYNRRIENWRKLQPDLKMYSGPLSKLILRPNPPGCGYSPLEIWYRIDSERYKRFEKIPYRGLLDGEPPIFWVVEIQSEDFHRDFIQTVSFALKYGHLDNRDCIYITRFHKTVGSLEWMIDPLSERFYVSDPRLREWYRVIPPEQPLRNSSAQTGKLPNEELDIPEGMGD